jgi:hypothetical protein
MKVLHKIKNVPIEYKKKRQTITIKIMKHINYI